MRNFACRLLLLMAVVVLGASCATTTTATGSADRLAPADSAVPADRALAVPEESAPIEADPELDGERASAPSCPASPEPSSTAAALSQLSIEVRLAGNGDLADEVLDLARALEASEPASDTLVTAAQLVPEALSVLRELTAPECLAEYEPALARLAGSTEALVPPAEAAPSLRDLLINGYGMAADDAACVDRGLTESRVTPDLADEVIVLAALSRCANEGGGA